MALNYKSGTETQSALTATTNGATIDLVAYDKLAVSLKFATCTGTTNTASVKMQTSADDSVWHDMTPVIIAETDAVDFDSDAYFVYWPDNSTAAEHGFHRYVRFVFTTGGTASVSYTIKWLARA